MEKVTKMSRQEGETTCPDASMLSALPMLTAHLVETAFDDGSPRLVSAVTVFIQEDKVKASLNDKNREASLFRSSDTLMGVFESIEEALASGEADWRPWKPIGKRK